VHAPIEKDTATDDAAAVSAAAASAKETAAPGMHSLQCVSAAVLHKSCTLCSCWSVHRTLCTDSY
jgi:hypothetical protein